MTSPDTPICVTCSATIRAAMEDAAIRAHPEEACGLLIGWWEVERLHITGLELSANRAENPLEGFEVDAGVQARVQRTLRESDFSVVGVWHSHPSGQSAPSEVDSLAAFDPDYIWMITSSGVPQLDTSAHLAPTEPGAIFRPVNMVWCTEPVLPA